MKTRRMWAICLALGLAFAIPGCGGGGGGGPSAASLGVLSVRVLTQAQGPQSPFGTTQGGDSVQINGTSFKSGLTVRFAGVLALIQSVSPSQILATSPPGAEGFIDITVTNPGGSSTTLFQTFQYLAPPVILSIQATTGPTTGENRAPIAGGETMQVTGQNFKIGAGVSVDGVPLAATFIDANTVTFAVPATPGEKTSDVVVTNPEGLSSTLVRGLIYTQEFSLDQETRSLTEGRARHLFRRAGFGASQRRISEAVADGLAATVDKLVNYTNDPTVETQAMTNYGANPPPAAGINVAVNKHWWLHLLAKNPNPLQERVAWFLHDHFAIAENGFSPDFRWTLHRYIQLMRRFTLSTSQTLSDGSRGLGYDWRQLCIEVAKDQAMLHWLDGRLSKAGNPNENFAREMWELFMLGEGRGYLEIDIQNAARAYTGFRWRRVSGQPYLSMEYRPSLHDGSPKTILGVTGRFGYDDIFPFNDLAPTAHTDPADTDGGMVALTLARRPVEASTFICGKLAEFFLYENVDDVVVNALAQRFRAPGPDQWNLRPILVTLLNSKAMYSTRALKGKIKNPVEFVLGFTRTTGLDLSGNMNTNAARLRTELINIGQVVLEPPDVAGWPTGIAWLGSQAMLERTNFVRFAIEQLDRQEQIDAVTPPRGMRTPVDLVDHIAALLDVKLSGNARTRLINYIATQLDSAGAVVPFSFDPTNFNHLKMKVRGLLWQIAPYYDGHQD